MPLRFIAYIILAFISIVLFVGLRFGLFGESKSILEPFAGQIIPKPSRTISPTLIPLVSPQTGSSSSTQILLLDAPFEASASKKFTIRWFVDTDTIATISHTAVHFGKNAKPHARLPSDYPEKSPIFSGPIPATFSAELTIDIPGIYYYRAHALLNATNVWSEEIQMKINAIPTPPSTPSATPTP